MVNIVWSTEIVPDVGHQGFGSLQDVLLLLSNERADVIEYS